MRPKILFALLTTAALMTAGCSASDEGETEPPEQEPAAKAPTRQANQTQPEPEPFRAVLVFNETLSFDVQSVAGKTFNVPEGAKGLGGRIDVMARELCSTLQANTDQEGPSVVLAAPGGATHSFKLNPRAAVCATDGEPLQTVMIDVKAEPGQWTIGLKGVGNVDTAIEIWAMP